MELVPATVIQQDASTSHREFSREFSNLYRSQFIHAYDIPGVLLITMVVKHHDSVIFEWLVSMTIRLALNLSHSGVF